MKKILLILFLALALPVAASSSRYVVNIEGRGIVEVDGIEVKVKIYNEDSKISASTSEDVDFKIRDARDGDKCEQQTDKTNSIGEIAATCYATKTGSYSVYVQSNDKGDESADFVLTFDAKPAPTATLTPTKAPSPTPEEEIIEEVEETAAVEEEPTPTPEEESKVAGFFENKGILIAVAVGILSLAALAFLLIKTKIIDLSKFKKKEKIKKIDVEGIYPPEEPKQA